MIKKIYLIVVVVLTLAKPALAQPDFSKVEIKTIPVAKNIYLLEGSGGNIGVSVGADGILIVDDQFAPLAPKIEAALRGLNPGKLKFVLNTHFHGDHTGGNAHFGRESHIIAQENVRKRLLHGDGTGQTDLPVITFDDSLHVHFNGEDIRVIHVPSGHTDGDSIIYFKGANVVHMGDQFFSGCFPNIDLGAGGSVRGYIKNVEDAIKTIPADAKIIPGHGPLGTGKELKEFHAMLVETSGIVEQAIKDGKTLEQVKAAGLPEKWKSWDWNLIPMRQYLEILYRGLSEPKQK